MAHFIQFQPLSFSSPYALVCKKKDFLTLYWAVADL